MKQKASLKDIAKKVGVSIPLVSYVLGGKGKENRVSEKTAKRIREVAKELNYHPNLSARSLKTNKTKTIGVVVADISNPFFSNLARIIEDEAFSRNYTVIFGSSDENVEKFNKVLEFLMSRQVDGFIVAAPEGSEKTILELTEQNIPLVLIDRYFRKIETNYVVVDNVHASVLATNHLLKKGHRKIGTVAYKSELAHYKDRCDGYFQALQNEDIPLNDEYIKRIGHLSLKRDMKKSIKELVLETDVDAIYFQTNTLAEEGLRQMIDLGRDVLKKIDVVVFDQNSTYHFLENSIPYVNQPIKEMGEKALGLLIDQIENKSSVHAQVRLKTKLETGSRNQVKV